MLFPAGEEANSHSIQIPIKMQHGLRARRPIFFLVPSRLVHFCLFCGKRVVTLSIYFSNRHHFQDDQSDCSKSHHIVGAEPTHCSPHKVIVQATIKRVASRWRFPGADQATHIAMETRKIPHPHLPYSPSRRMTTRLALAFAFLLATTYVAGDAGIAPNASPVSRAAACPLPSSRTTCSS